MQKVITLFLLFLPGLILGQNFHGKIFDEINNPVQDALIRNLAQDAHTHTNILGEFRLANVQLGDSLEVSHLGFHSALIIINQENIDHTYILKLAEKQVSLEEVEIAYQKNPLQTLVDLDLMTNPVKSSQEVLRKVPGLFIGQHAGGGKAEQIFFRGFDIDHGTDINISVDGMPVNMVSHAHGQGYADLHFLIPETIEKLNFGKGGYYADQGNFSTAGYVDFQTKEKLSGSQLKVQAGQFQTLRSLAMIDLLENKENMHAYLASELIRTQGPFEAPQNFGRLNIMGKYTFYTPDDGKLSLSVSHFTSNWTASGQIPQRAVDQGQITRFGAIDSTEGGNTSRTNVQLSFMKYLNSQTSIQHRLYYSRYDFDLISNFTFFLRDSINGDQIRQRENRSIWGGSSELTRSGFLGNSPVEWNVGTGFRMDDVNDIELSYTRNRNTILEPVQKGNIDEINVFGYASAEIKLGKWIINPGVRVDGFNFQYENLKDSSSAVKAFTMSTFSPKFNVNYRPNSHVQLYLKSGKSFHSNDTRLILSDRAISKPVPATYGADLGGIFRLSPQIILDAAFWGLYMEQEFVYVGDEGIIEPSGRTRRLGIDFGSRTQIGKFLNVNGNINYAFARSLDEEMGQNYIPLAPDLTIDGGISWVHPKGFSGGIKSRYLAARPANEDNSIIAEGYFITDLNVGYQWQNFQVRMIIENLFNQEWNETQFATESRLRGEPLSVEEIHFTPGTP
ncbi:MAG: TonB-dependent receptor, partial [Bacteroidetes bacterium]|nr:TonB-dependent receptor [Bacteroidota bacterium]